MVEYALLIALIAVVAIVVIGIVGSNTSKAFDTVGQSMGTATN
jgi:Flp pilus assembly pilin Flp